MVTISGTEGVHAPVVDFPASIQTALARIMGCDGGDLHTLTYRERSLLARLIRNVSTQDPTSSIRVTVSTLAAALQTCNKTIQRTFNSLREKGWVTRDQIKKRSGMQIADTWLTRSTLELLGLVPAPYTRAASDNMSGASSLSTMSKDSQQIPGPSAPEAKEPPLPADVQLLEKMGLRRGAIFKLMGEATKAGHRLGHIVRAAAPLIEKARHVYGYLLKLIGQQRDWSTFRCAALRKQEAEVALQAEVKAVQDDRALVYQALEGGRRLINQAKTRVLLLLDGAVHACSVDDLTRPDWRYRCAPDSRIGQMAEALRAGRLAAY